MKNYSPAEEKNARQWLTALQKRLQSVTQSSANWLRLCLIAAAIGQIVGEFVT